MGGSTGAAPEQDPAFGKAALMSAKTGKQALRWSQKQAKIANNWARNDRKRYNKLFKPIENKFVKDSQNYDTHGRRSREMDRAGAQIRKQGAISRGTIRRQEAAMGVDPRSGRSASSRDKVAMAESMAVTGGRNAAREAVMTTGRQRTAEAINMGRGMAVNPGQSLSMATGAGNSGFQAAMSGYGQQANILNTGYQNDMDAYQSKVDANSGLMSGLGALAGTALQSGMFPSDEQIKENKRPARGSLRAVEKMRVDDWDYKEGEGDGGSHTGTYAQDFQRETGKGDGKTINVIDAIGVTMGAVKELSSEVKKLGRGTQRAAA